MGLFGGFFTDFRNMARGERRAVLLDVELDLRFLGSNTR
jgi:hypothetical protein